MDIWFKYIRALWALTVGLCLFVMPNALAQTAQVGDVVRNIATISFETNDTEFNFNTNTAEFIVEEAPALPTIEFFRHAPTAPSPLIRQINGADFSTTGNSSGPFQAVPPALAGDGSVLDLSSPIPLFSAATYNPGETIFVQVTDERANNNPALIDTAVITVSTSSGDAITLRLFETGPDTGEFFAHFPSTDVSTANFDDVLTTNSNDQLTAVYNNGFVQSQAVTDTALIDPFGRVFDSSTGEPVDGAIVRLVNAGDLTPASVWGVDSLSVYPAEVVSGASATDTSGLFYEFDVGEFRFPVAETGEYFVEVIPPEGFNFASEELPPHFQTLGNFIILDASFGENFSVAGFAGVQFDIPLDPEGELLLTKTADVTTGDVGDFIPYTVDITNIGATPTPVDLMDTLPLGFRYIEGSALRDGQTFADPVISPNATSLTFPLGLLPIGETVTLNYTLEVGPGAPLGDAINEAVVLDQDGDQISNVGRAEVTLEEELFRTRSTIIGRISENSCDADEEWARDINEGIGVEGVRVYMETGAYAVTDGFGLYHFEGVDENTHVVQVDVETLPEGYEPMICEENSRYAGSATSKFIEVQGGGIWRANFYLEKTSEVAEIVEDQEYDAQTAYLEFDDAWLNKQSGEAHWVYPDPSSSPSHASLNFGISHRPSDKVTARLNGAPINKVHITARDMNALRLAMITRWRGVDLREGDNHFEIDVHDKNGKLLKSIRETIVFARNVMRAAGVPDQSILVADGRTLPEIAIRLEDEAGRQVHPGRIVNVDVTSPYRLYSESGERDLLVDGSDQLAPLSARELITVGQGGIARIKLEPTLQTGKVTVIVTLDNGRKVPIYMYLAPEKRDWILVGLAEGTAGFDEITGGAVDISSSDDDVFSDGRVAFFAKGLIKGEWLLTLAVDTDNGRGDIDGDFATEIDPNAYYTLYGDRSYVEFEAVTRYPVYVKIEKSHAYALFGDFDTNITEGRLTAYNRRLSGLKAEYIGETFQVLGFAAETNQGFAKDEIPADGTSGVYQLSSDNILVQSETIIVETRDRFRPDIILDSKPMVRFLDYTLDYLTGELLFRLPVDVSDAEFNPNVIVVDYETSEQTERNITAGGRVQAQILNDRVQVGSTFVSEGGAADRPNSRSNQVGVDIIADVTDRTQIRAEYAVTENDTDTGRQTSDAILAEVTHIGDDFSGEAFFRQEDEGFGLGQRNSNTNTIRRYGASGRYQFNQDDEDSGRTTSKQTVEVDAYREENLATGGRRTTGDIELRHQTNRYSVGGGLRVARDEIPGEADRESILATGQASYSLPEHGLTFQIAHEQPLGGEDEVSAFPQRTTLGVDKTFGNNITASVRHEILVGEGQNNRNTTAGLSTTPWKGAALTASSDLLTADSGRRLGATIGLDQQVQLTDKWSLSAGVRNRRVLDEDGVLVDIAPDAAISPLEVNEDFTSAYLGFGFRNDVLSASLRGETRQAGTGDDTYILSSAVAREVSEKLSLAGASRFVLDDKALGVADSTLFDLRLGAAWRPKDEGTVWLNRLDVSRQSTEGLSTTTKIVNNAAMNTYISDRWQLSANYGVKYNQTEINGQSLDSLTHLLGAETRFDVTKKIDLSLRGQVLANEDFSEAQYSFGPSIGISPIKDVWVSLGYNFEGFRDDDFEAAEFSRDGIFLRFRVKFDQDTAQGLLRRISPSSYQTP